jgi:Spx/MgsR family transcriptional regulator
MRGGASAPNRILGVERSSTQELPVPVTIYGIPNCDTMKKARAWLESHGVAYAFHDYRASGLDPRTLDAWVDRLGWEVLLNKASTSFRALPDADRQGLDAKKAKALMLANPTMIKRPVLDLGDRLLVGFKPDVYERDVG